jgi:hypothetical protein
MSIKETLRGIIREEVQNVLKEDDRSDIISRLQRMPMWKKYEMSFMHGPKMSVGKLKDGRKTYSIIIQAAKTPHFDWQEEKSAKLIQKHFPDYTVVPRHGVSGGQSYPGWATYTFVTKA